MTFRAQQCHGMSICQGINEIQIEDEKIYMIDMDLSILAYLSFDAFCE